MSDQEQDRVSHEIKSADIAEIALSVVLAVVCLGVEFYAFSEATKGHVWPALKLAGWGIVVLGVCFSPFKIIYAGLPWTVGMPKGEFHLRDLIGIAVMGLGFLMVFVGWIAS